MALFNRHKEPLALPDPRKQPMAACDLSSITRGLQQAAAAPNTWWRSNTSNCSTSFSTTTLTTWEPR